MRLNSLMLTFFLMLTSFSTFSQKSNPFSSNTFKFNKKKKVINEIDVKTKKCVLYDGLFNFYQNNENGTSFIEIDTSHIDQEYIYFSYYENGVGDARINKGTYRGSKIIKISKFYDKIDFTIENTKYYFDPNSPLSKASNTNINSPIIISEKIIATSPCKTKFLINADNIFLNESFQQIKSSYSGKYKGFKLGNLSKTKTRLKKSETIQKIQMC